MAADVDGDARRENRRRFLDFLDQDFGQGTYATRVRTMVESNRRRLIVNLNHLRQFDADFTRRLLHDPQDFIPAFEAALQEYIRNNNLAPARLENEPDETKENAATRVASYRIGFEGSFGANYVSPRTLSARFLRSLLCVEGIVTKCSLVHPKLVKSVHYCEATHQFQVKEYRDATSLDGSAPVGFSYPTKDDNNNPLTTEFGMCDFKDHQTITIQEMPERAPAGQLPRSVEVVVEGDLVDLCKPGDRVQIVGVFRPLPGFKAFGWTKATFRSIVIANQVTLLSKEVQGPIMTDEDIDKIKKLAQRPDVFTLIASSLAPSIFGHDQIKRAVLLLLLGGNEKTMQNGHHIRGDINMLLVGDPSTAKSQLLRFVLNIAPLAISTNGRGSSGVGLTAAVTSDKETGERRLEAGAMVLADRGVVCIDEFDKMSEDDRVAIHEVMEQQTVTISKAGIHAQLNARCSVLAAANPVYGKYNRQKKPTENIALPDSLLSRFDMLFIVLDSLSAEQDRCIAEHVLRMHQYRPPNLEDGRPIDPYERHMMPMAEKDEDEKTEMFVKFDAALHAQKDGAKAMILSIPFIKKYLLYAKYRVVPRLTEDVCSFITEAYAELRSKDDMKTLPITPRTLETLFRLTVAHAKCCLRDIVLLDDAKVALSIVQFALYQEAAPVPRAAPVDGKVDSEAKHAPLKRARDEGEPLSDLGSRNVPSDAPAPATPMAADMPAPAKRPAKKLSAEEGKKLRATLNQLFKAAKGKAVKLSVLVSELEKQKVGLSAESVHAAIAKFAKDGTLLFDAKTEEIRQL